MTNGIPVRLSAALTVRARAAASVLDRSLTDQVEHWARLGQVVEAAISANTVQRLKARSYDANLPALLAAADTDVGAAKAAKLIAARNPVRHGVEPGSGEIRVQRSRKRTRPSRAR